jgi:hypothetical protein
LAATGCFFMTMHGRSFESVSNCAVFRGPVFRVQEEEFSGVQVFLPNTDHLTLNTQ